MLDMDQVTEIKDIIISITIKICFRHSLVNRVLKICSNSLKKKVILNMRLLKVLEVMIMPKEKKVNLKMEMARKNKY